MAFPTYSSVTSGFSGSTSSFTPTLPSHASGDKIFVFVAANGTGTLATSSAGWTKLGQVITNSTATSAVFECNADSSSESITITTPSTTLTWIAFRVSGTSLSHQLSTGAKGSSANANPPSLTPSAGTQDYLWVALSGLDASTPAASAGPSGYSNFFAVSQSCSAAIAFRQNRSASEDPGAFTTDDDQWSAWTLAIWGAGVTHELVANGITTGSPVLGAPALTQSNSMVASPITTASPVLGAPALTQDHLLTGSALTVSSPVLGEPPLTNYAGELWAPSDYAGDILLWYDCEDATTITESAGQVTAWNDKSGNAHHLAQATEAKQGVREANATFGGLHTISFPVAGGMVSTTGPVDDLQYWTNGSSLALNAYSASQSFPLTAVISAYYDGSGNAVIRVNGTQIGSNAAAQTPAAARTIFVVVHIRSSGQSSTQSRIFDQYSGANFVLGNRDTDWTRTADMDFAEVIIVDTAVSLDDIELFEGGLAWKWQIGSLLAAGHPYEDGPPVLSASLVASPLTVGSPVLGAPAITQDHLVSAPNFATASPVLGAPALTQAHQLTASGLTTSSPVLATPALTQSQVLAAGAFSVSSPVLAAPALTQAHLLSASGLTTGSPVFGAPALTQDHILAAAALTVGSPVLGTPVLTMVFALEADDLAIGSPVLGSPALTQDHLLTANAIATDSPVLGAPAVSQAHLLSAAAFVVGAPVLGAPGLTQDHLLTVGAFSIGAPVLGTPALAQAHLLEGVDLVVASPVLGTPVLSEGALLADDLIVGSPVMGTPALTQSHVLTPQALAVASPVLGSPALVQAHLLVGSDLTVSGPVLGAPALVQAHLLTADGFSVGAPVLSSSLLTQAHLLAAADWSIASPVIASVALGQAHLLAALGLTVGSPVFGEVALVQAHLLEADELVLGAPDLGQPALAQLHVLLANSISTGSPVLGTPVLYLRSLRPRRFMFIIG